MSGGAFYYLDLTNMKNSNENIVIVTFNGKNLQFDLTNTKDRELLETLKAVWAGTHASIIVESANTDVEQATNNDTSSQSE